jgi:hypothetical protein
MRISALIVLAIVSCAALAARAEDAAPSTPAAPIAAEQPAQSAPQKSTTEPAPTSAEESKADKQSSAETKSATRSNSGRFGFERTDDGFLRFDYQTGQVAYCNARPDGWACQPVPENRTALERELDQLRAEVADLKNQIQALREPPRPVPPETVPPSKAPAAPPTNAEKGGDLSFSIPGREHISRAAGAVQDAWQHFVDLVIGLTNDIRRKTGA